ncbi:apolipoprotein D-like [Antennarius striatus]|uniref:apolipoprotein D-like n=1 Tax=Antennarius striatus TaxID=241820 RepID=UPI0035B07215
MNAVQVIFLTLLSALAVSAQVLKFGECPQPTVQANFDLNRYIGKWYEIQKLPTAFQRGECSTATYSLISPGVVRVFNKELLDDGTINTIFGSAQAKDPAEPAKLQVSFDGILSPPNPYWVLSTNYENHALVYSCTDFGLFHIELSWILSREPTLSEGTLNQLRGILSSAGVDVNKLISTIHSETYCSAVNQ